MKQIRLLVIDGSGAELASLIFEDDKLEVPDGYDGKLVVIPGFPNIDYEKMFEEILSERT